LMQKYKTGYVDDFHSKKRKGKGTRNKLGKNSLPIPCFPGILTAKRCAPCVTSVID
jgi:hypothetical protein